MPNFDALVCKYCFRPNWLPVPTRPGTLHNQPWWPMDGMPRNYLCFHCKHVSVYYGRDVRQIWFDPQQPDPRIDHRGSSIVCIEARCGEESCVAPVRILAVMGTDANPNVEGEKLLSQMTVDEMRCILDHVQGRTRGTPLFHFDEDWQQF